MRITIDVEEVDNGILIDIEAVDIVGTIDQEVKVFARRVSVKPPYDHSDQRKKAIFDAVENVYTRLVDSIGAKNANTKTAKDA